ncbi:hypothetical protein [Flagellimonas nanhaiensis]|uniref:Uncharacterized protein n=1 Tax=Flagellimonas nanhaiensis TaxID=2292706 RepID=A0A371JLV0_9FLAO|nr:hypothetical protein [Allomuricauda nanhaiensis]RDY57928.1 hypothetical protein DX873_17430 [Allomuricauda nanhaiensis]
MIDHACVQYAYDKAGNRVSVFDVPWGKDTGCFCRICEEPLGAKNKGKTRETILKPNQKAAHFYHISASNCSGETLMHMLAKEVFQESKKLLFQIERRNHHNEFLDYEEKIVEFDEVVLEKQMLCGNSSIQPDAIAVVKGKQLLVEFAFTHEVEYEKEELIQKAKLDCIEIYLNVNWIAWNEFKTEEELKQRITTFLHKECGMHQHWIYNEKYQGRPIKIIDYSKQEMELEKIDRQLATLELGKKEALTEVLGLKSRETLMRILNFEGRYDFLRDKNFYLKEDKVRVKEPVVEELMRFKEKYGQDWNKSLPWSWPY